MNQSESVISKNRILYNTLNKKQTWYTGIPKKKYIQENIFSINPNFYNKSITVGRWSGYAHFSGAAALGNLLQKNHIDKNSIVLIHPLLPNFLIDQILSVGCRVIISDIDKNSLNFDTGELGKTIENSRPDIIINYAPLGIYNQLIEQNNLSSQAHIPQINCILETAITLDLLALFEAVNLGGVIFIQNPSLVQNHLNLFLKSPLPDSNYYLSWHIEGRMRSILEYHLSESQEQYLQLVEVYFYLTLKSNKGLIKNLIPKLAQNTIIKNSFNSVTEAQNSIHSNWSKLEKLDIPDVFFDLEYFHPTIQKPISYSNLQNRDSYLIKSARDTYQFLVSQVSLQPEGSLEVSSYLEDQTYLNFGFYTTNHSYWQNYFNSRGLNYRTQETLHSIVADFGNSNLDFISKYSGYVNLTQLINNNIKLYGG